MHLSGASIAFERRSVRYGCQHERTEVILDLQLEPMPLLRAWSSKWPRLGRALGQQRKSLPVYLNGWSYCALGAIFLVKR
jgi:hypothetical protein